jgi:hypothetical protein
VGIAHRGLDRMVTCQHFYRSQVDAGSHPVGSGFHTVVITNAFQKNGDSSGYFISVDRYDVQ